MSLTNTFKRLFRSTGLLVVVGLTACAPLATAAPPTQPSIPTVAQPTQPPPPRPTPFPTFTPTDIPTLAPTVTPTPLPAVDLSQLSVVFQFVMIDSLKGWAVTKDGVLYTEDGGQTWFDVTPPVLRGQGAPTDGAFLDAQNAALLSVLPQDPTRSLFLKTTDGGLTWATATAPFGMGTLQFLDPQHGFALASLDIGAGQNPVAVYRTDDGGGTWTQVFADNPQNPAQNGIPVGGDKNGLAFADLANGWVSGVEPVDGLVYLYRSQDGGKTWAHQDAPLAHGTEKAQFNTQPPRFFGGGKGAFTTQAFLTTNASPAYDQVIYATADSGATWNLVKALPVAGPVDLATAVDWFVWTGSALQVTHDGGQGWIEVQPTGLEGVKIPAMLEFVSAKDGWLISVETEKVRLFRTADGGQTWQRLTK